MTVSPYDLANIGAQALAKNMLIKKLSISVESQTKSYNELIDEFNDEEAKEYYRNCYTILLDAFNAENGHA